MGTRSKISNCISETKVPERNPTKVRKTAKTQTSLLKSSKNTSLLKNPRETKEKTREASDPRSCEVSKTASVSMPNSNEVIQLSQATSHDGTKIDFQYVQIKQTNVPNFATDQYAPAAEIDPLNQIESILPEDQGCYQLVSDQSLEVESSTDHDKSKRESEVYISDIHQQYSVEVEI